MGIVKKTNSYHHGCDFTYGDGEPCPKWKIAEDLIEHRSHKNKKYERVSLLGEHEKLRHERYEKTRAEYLSRPGKPVRRRR